MSFDRSMLPDPEHYYSQQGLPLTGRGAWRTTRCDFHGGSDSMRVHVRSGGFVCMAGCGARGGDVVAYHMAQHGQDFVQAAKELGAYVEDGKPSQQRPTALSAGAAMQLCAAEANLVAVTVLNLKQGVTLTEADLQRLIKAASRIMYLAEVTK